MPCFTSKSSIPTPTRSLPEPTRLVSVLVSVSTENGVNYPTTSNVGTARAGIQSSFEMRVSQVASLIPSGRRDLPRPVPDCWAPPRATGNTGSRQSVKYVLMILGARRSGTSSGPSFLNIPQNNHIKMPSVLIYPYFPDQNY